jgi:hypothetical protein
MVAGGGDANRLDQPLLTEMSEIARAWIGRTIVMVSQVTTGDHSKRADRCKRARFRSAQGVLSVAATNDLSFQPPRQVNAPREHVAGIEVTLASVTVALRPARITARIAVVLGGIRLPGIVARTAAKFSRIIVAITGATVR